MFGKYFDLKDNDLFIVSCAELQADEQSRIEHRRFGALRKTPRTEGIGVLPLYRYKDREGAGAR